MTLFQRAKLSARFLFGFNARYEGGRYNTPGRSITPGTVQSARMDLTRCTREEMVRKSRYYEKNNGYYNRMADLYEQYTVGQGIGFFPASSDAEWNRKWLIKWQKWQRFADISSRLSYGTLQGIIARALFVDGEIFILKTHGETGFPRIQLIESHRVCSPNNQIDTATLVDGIEIDANGRPVAYHISTGWKEDGVSPNKWARYDADSIVHVMEPGRASQYRGIPACYPVINDLIDLDDLQLLEMQACKDAAQTSEVIKTASGEIDDEAVLRGTVTNSDGVTRDTFYRDIFGARVKVLKTGDEYSQHRSERPTAATSGYWDVLLTKICSGIGIAREIVIPGSMQGTSMRSVLDVSAAYFRSRSSVIADHLRQVYEWATEEHIRIDAELRQPPADFYLCTYRSPRSINVDVGRNSNAMIEEWRSGMRTLQDIYGEAGEDWQQGLRQKASEVQFAQKLAEEFEIERSEIILIDPSEMQPQQDPNQQPQ